MFTLVGFYDATTHAALAAVDAIDDPHMRVSGNDIYVPELNRIMGALAAGADMTECRLQSPSLRRMANQRIAPVGKQALPLVRSVAAVDDVGDDANLLYHDFRVNPRVLDIAESLNAYAANGGDTAEWILAWLMDKIEPLPAGTMFSIEATTNPTGVLGNWVNDALTFSQTLPAGRYAVVGMRVEDTAVVAARLVFVGLPWRPGVIGVSGTDLGDIKAFRFGGTGSWGEFEHDAPPTVDTLANAAGAITPEVILDLVQVRAGRR